MSLKTRYASSQAIIQSVSVFVPSRGVSLKTIHIIQAVNPYYAAFSSPTTNGSTYLASAPQRCASFPPRHCVGTEFKNDVIVLLIFICFFLKVFVPLRSRRRSTYLASAPYRSTSLRYVLSFTGRYAGNEFKNDDFIEKLGITMNKMFPSLKLTKCSKWE